MKVHLLVKAQNKDQNEGFPYFVKDLNRIEKRIILPLRTDVCQIAEQNLPCLSQEEQ
jgi:hypothetical protein